MLESAVCQVRDDAQRLESLSASYAHDWSDTVSERVFSGISALSSSAGNISSQLYTQAYILNGIKAELSQLAQF